MQIQIQKQKYKIKQLHGHLEDLSTLFTMVHSRVLTTRPTRLIILIVFTTTVPVAENKLHKYEVTTRKKTERHNKSTFRDGGSTALYYTVDIVHTVDMVYTVDTISS